MSRLLGIVNPSVDPGDPFNYWLWQAIDIPLASEWDYERLNVYTTPAPDSNVCVWVTGPPTEKYRDGVFLKLMVNSDHHPQPRITADALAGDLKQSWEIAAESRTALTPLADMQ
jgi:Ni,Fe-hydrogenase III small subunit